VRYRRKRIADALSMDAQGIKTPALSTSLSLSLFRSRYSYNAGSTGLVDGARYPAVVNSGAFSFSRWSKDLINTKKMFFMRGGVCNPYRQVNVSGSLCKVLVSCICVVLSVALAFQT
jgi:hypothetical protein